MADNINVSEGSGVVVAADEIASVKYQRIKIIHGADGANDGDVSTANPLPVVQTGTPALPTGAATAAHQVTANGHLDGLEGLLTTIDADTGDIATDADAIRVSVELIDDAIKTDDAAFTPGTTKVLMAGFEADESSTDSVDEGDAGAARMTLDRKQIVTAQAHTSGGATPYKLVSAASTNATSVKGSAGQVYMITASNVNAAVRYLKFYNKATSPTVGTDTPVCTFAIPGNTAGAGTNIPVPACGLEFGTGIALALTTEATDAGSTGVAANEIVVNLGYK
jgi:hypothetical protein